MAINYPILKSLTIDGVTSGFDPEWGMGYVDERNILNPAANTWTDGASIILPKGIYIVGWTIVFPAASTTGQTTYQSQMHIDGVDKRYTETWVSSVSNANSKILSRIAGLTAQRTLTARFSASRAISGAVKTSIYAYRLVDMMPDD